jgi:hypothetical protein
MQSDEDIREMDTMMKKEKAATPSDEDGMSTDTY